MAAAVKSFNFVAATATGNQVVDTGFGAEIKALILAWTNQTADGFVAGERGGISFCKSSTARKCVSWAGDDNVATTVTGGAQEDLAIRILTNGTPTLGGAADFVSFGTGADAGKFTINWTTAAGQAIIIRGMAIGGADVTGTFVGQFAAPTVAGSRDDTGVGFQGKVVFFLTRLNGTALGSGANGRLGFGAAVSSTKRGFAIGTARDNVTSTTQVGKHYKNNVACMATTNASGAAIQGLTDFTGFIADGYTLPWGTAANAADLYFALVIGGTNLSVDLDEISAPAAIGNQVITTGFDMSNGGVVFFGSGQATANATLANESHICLGFGGGSAIAENLINTAQDDTINTDANSRTVGTNVLSAFTPPSTVAAEADYLSNGPTEYTIDWTTTASGRIWFGVALAGLATPAAANIPYQPWLHRAPVLAQ